VFSLNNQPPRLPSGAESWQLPATSTSGGADPRTPCRDSGIFFSCLPLDVFAITDSRPFITFGIGQDENWREPVIELDWRTLRVRKGEHLPHWNCDNAIYHVCYRLADSIPRGKIIQLQCEKDLIRNSLANRNRSLTRQEEARLRYLYARKIERLLDAGYGKCYLRKPDIAGIVRESLEYFEGKRYYLHAWSIMPNHVHVIVEPVAGWQLSKIVRSWKSFTANRINKRLRRGGQLWQHESYDHIIRNETEYRETVEYVWNNPVKAGLNGCLRWRKE